MWRLPANWNRRCLPAKCAAVYLNAGSGSPDPAKARNLEYNVALDPISYAAIFDLPCPVYWLPCFEEVGKAPAVDMWSVKEYGSYYKFQHREVFGDLSDKTRNFFTFMYRGGRTGGRSPRPATQRMRWLGYLLGPQDQAELERQSTLWRNMWCTGGQLHAVGMTVTRQGKIVAMGEAGNNAVFTFDPIQLTCDDSGVTSWRPTTDATNRYIFHVRDVAQYQAAMTRALASLLAELP